MKIYSILFNSSQNDILCKGHSSSDFIYGIGDGIFQNIIWLFEKGCNEGSDLVKDAKFVQLTGIKISDKKDLNKKAQNKKAVKERQLVKKRH